MRVCLCVYVYVWVCDGFRQIKSIAVTSLSMTHMLVNHHHYIYYYPSITNQFCQLSFSKLNRWCGALMKQRKAFHIFWKDFSSIHRSFLKSARVLTDNSPIIIWRYGMELAETKHNGLDTKQQMKEDEDQMADARPSVKWVSQTPADRCRHIGDNGTEFRKLICVFNHNRYQVELKNLRMAMTHKSPVFSL